MEKIFDFLHEDVLYIINEYAKENSNKQASHFEKCGFGVE